MPWPTCGNQQQLIFSGDCGTMLMVKVKICGITSADDAIAAVELGADLLGFNFYPQSPRYVPFEQAESIIRKIPTSVDTVGVFVNPQPSELKQIVDAGFFNWIQLHGDETPEYCSKLSWTNARIIKGIRVRSADDIQRAYQYPVDAILLDSYDKNIYGGTGKPFDWSLIGNLHRRLFLAGGINPGNVAEAMQNGVYCIDVCSGIESAPGKKDRTKMKQLFDNIRVAAGQKVRA
jgi:phosphoribosylanthranilate isomerase